jgi:hypothetical protein
MLKLSLTALLLASLAGVLGCGSSENASVSVSRGPDADALIVGPRDLPDGAVAGESPPELCGPLPILEDKGTQTAISPMFAFGQKRVTEAVGVFGATRPATAAYEALNSQKRIECIRSAIESFGPGQGSVRTLPPRPLRIGNEDSLVRYRVLAPGSRLQSSVDVVAIRSGRCVAALLFAANGDGRLYGVTSKVSETANELLTGACR